MKEYQEAVDAWIKEYGVRYFSEVTNTLILAEEVGEFARIIAREYGEQSYKSKPTDIKASLADELADIFFVATCLANQLDIDLQEALIANMAKKTGRDSERHKSNEKL